jgi:hypothetical protein
MVRRRIILLAAVALLAVSATSCGKADGRTPTFPVAGKVLLPDGKPAEHATVVFHPVRAVGDGVVKPRGKVGPDGTFRLTTYDGDDGAPAGEYRVTVELWLANTRTDAPPTSRLPPKYANPETSGLTATIDGGPTEIKTIALKR